MNKIIENLWAKKRSDENGQFWLPLLIHLKDTKNVINFLYNHWISEGQKEILISDFDSIVEENTGDEQLFNDDEKVNEKALKDALKENNWI